MPSMTQHPVSHITKMLLLGESGSGKTGSLASLVKAGYNLRILDFDNGVDIYKNLLEGDTEALGRITYETLTDKMKGVAGKSIPDGMPTAFSRATALLDRWQMKETLGPDGEVYPAYDLGQITSWGSNDVLVIDSLTMMANAAMRWVLTVNNRPPGVKQLQDYGAAQDMIEAVLQRLYCDAVKCNVIVISHVAYIGEENDMRGLPMALGKALSPKIPRYFNTMLLCRTEGTGPGARRKIHTQPTGIVELKNTAPIGMPASFPLETGIADFFAIVQGKKATTNTTSTKTVVKPKASLKPVVLPQDNQALQIGLTDQPVSHV